MNVTSAKNSQGAAQNGPPLRSDYEEQLGEYLTALTEVQSKLLELLEKKRRAMASGDLPAIASFQQQEQVLAGELEELQRRRGELLASAAQEGLAAEDLRALARRLERGKPGKLASQVNQAAARMQLLQHTALTNWVIAQRSLLHISQMLEILATGGRLLPTYDPHQSQKSCCGGLVDQEA
ncbi:MAG: hypothetical protein KatS3mg110_3025 [Pirellulaceae bacterium]|nr:MAG: hypothetical protein KatS3mg110_3025 [Pirellulaceae bacterium]